MKLGAIMRYSVVIRLLKKKGAGMSRADIKARTAKEALTEKLAQMIDKKYDEMSDEEIKISQQKLRALRDRVRASRVPKRETA